MGVVRPITDRNVLEQMKEHMRERSTRNYLIFRVGLNLGLSVQDILNLKVEDLLNKEVFNCQKWGICISDSLQKEVRNYVGERTSGYLFISSTGKQLSRFQLYGILRSAARAANFEGPIGAVTLRKTFAYWAYMEKQIYLPLLSKYLNHSTVQYTLYYMGIEEQEIHEENLTAVDL